MNRQPFMNNVYYLVFFVCISDAITNFYKTSWNPWSLFCLDEKLRGIVIKNFIRW